MSEPSRKPYRPWEPQRYRHAAQSPNAKLAEGEMVCFVLETVPKLDLSRFSTP
jgi:transposase